MDHSETISKKELMERYSEYILSNDKRPKTVYTFTKSIDITEAGFYHHFGGFTALEKAYFSHFFEESHRLLVDSKQFAAADAKEKLLNLYFVIFENLALNRSLVLLLLEGGLKTKARHLEGLQKKLFHFYDTLDFSENRLFEKASEHLQTLSEKSRKKVLWMHFLSILKFWIDDESSDFEQTDVYIEKSVDTGFEMIENPLVDKVLDLGKFLWKEKMHATT